jgi:hypothetical protein
MPQPISISQYAKPNCYAKLDILLAHLDFLTKWEQVFVQSLNRKDEVLGLTDKQMSKVDEIYDELKHKGLI